MKTASLSEIKKALNSLTHAEIKDICLRLAKSRIENKELLTYLIFEADDKALFIKHVKEEVNSQFTQMHPSNLYLAKKTIRKVLKTVQKNIRFTGCRQTEVELLMHFCVTLRESGLPFQQYPVIRNIYLRQIQKIQKALETLHEDLQYDYQVQLEKL